MKIILQNTKSCKIAMISSYDLVRNTYLDLHSNHAVIPNLSTNKSTTGQVVGVLDLSWLFFFFLLTAKDINVYSKRLSKYRRQGLSH